MAEVGVKADWRGLNANENEITIDSFSFVNDEADYLKDWIVLVLLVELEFMKVFHLKSKSLIQPTRITYFKRIYRFNDCRL